MHDSIGLSVIGIVFAVIAEYGPMVAALAVCIDAMRRPASDLQGSIPGGRWTWFAPNVAFLFAVALGYVGVRATVLSYGVLVLYALVVVFDIAYLLRVVFPSPPRRAERAARDAGEAR